MTDVLIAAPLAVVVPPKPRPAACVCARQPEDCGGKPAGGDGLCKHCRDASCGLYRVEGGAKDAVLHVNFAVGAPVSGRYRPLTGVLA